VQADVVGRDVLDARCAILEQSVRQSGVATAAQIDAVRPGGAENLDRSAMGALFFFGALSRWHAQGPQQPHGKASMRWSPSEIRDIQDALAATPIPVPLECAPDKSVFPKGEFAIRRLEEIDHALGWLAVRRVAAEYELEENATPAALEAIRLCDEAIAQLSREFIWILTHPGADVPWADNGEWEHQPPKWTRAATTFDFIAVQRAHREVNSSRAEACSARLRHLAKTEDSMPMEAFTGLMANELAVQPRELVRKWSRGELFVQALLKADAHQRAVDAAERK
jgi:hypothetical protein